MSSRPAQKRKLHRAISAERDAYAALLGALDRQLARDVKTRAIEEAASTLIRRRIATMVEQIGLGLHLTGGGS